MTEFLHVRSWYRVLWSGFEVQHRHFVKALGHHYLLLDCKLYAPFQSKRCRDFTVHSAKGAKTHIQLIVQSKLKFEKNDSLIVLMIDIYILQQ